MQNNKKLTVKYSINLDEETAAQVEKIADYLQRKPAELLRLILAPQIVQLYADMQREQHPENKTPMQVAKFTKLKKNRGTK